MVACVGAGSRTARAPVRRRGPALTPEAASPTAQARGREGEGGVPAALVDRVAAEAGTERVVDALPDVVRDRAGAPAVAVLVTAIDQHLLDHYGGSEAHSHRFSRRIGQRRRRVRTRERVTAPVMPSMPTRCHQ